MILCDKSCYPCCDFCIYVKHYIIETEDIYGAIHKIRGGPIGCTKFNDKKHDLLAEDCSFCNDFHCVNSHWPDFWINIGKEDWLNEYNKLPTYWG